MTIEHSASSLELFLGCPRRWVFERIYGFRQEDTDQKTFGKSSHSLLETWVKTGKFPGFMLPAEAPSPPEVTLTRKMIALYAEHPYYPSKDFATAEEHFHMEILGVKWHGFTDWRRPGRHAGHRIVGDWKTTKDLKYALKADKATGLLVEPETGAVKAQPVIYATREYVEGADEVTLSWAYGQSKTPWATRLVKTDVIKSACEDAYGTFHAKALEMNQLYQIRPKANDVPYKKGYCNAFNKPCEQTERCVRPRGMFNSSPLDLDSGAADMKNFLDTMRETFPQSDVDDDLPPPPPPPPSEDDAPPAPPSDDEDAPPPPPDAEELEAERLAQEYMASRRPPRTAPTTVEAGFINAPEAAGKKPYATPEEAAIGEGVAIITLVNPADAEHFEMPAVGVRAAEDVAASRAGEATVVAPDARFDEAMAIADRVSERDANLLEKLEPAKKQRKARAKKADKAANHEVVDVDAEVEAVVEATGKSFEQVHADAIAGDPAAMSIVATENDVKPTELPAELAERIVQLREDKEQFIYERMVGKIYIGRHDRTPVRDVMGSILHMLVEHFGAP